MTDERNPFELRPRVDAAECRELYRRAVQGDDSLTMTELVAAHRLETFGAPMPCPVCATALTVYDAATDPNHRIDEAAGHDGYRCPACETSLYRSETGRAEGERLVWFWLTREPLDPEVVKRLRGMTELRRASGELEREEEDKARERILAALREEHPCRTCRNEVDDCVDCEGTGVEPGVIETLIAEGKLR